MKVHRQPKPDGMTSSSWDALVAKWGINYPPSIEATEEDVSDAEALQTVQVLQGHRGIKALRYRGIEVQRHSNSTALLSIVRIAVQQQHQEWAKEVMLETWQEHLDGVGTKVKVDLL